MSRLWGRSAVQASVADNYQISHHLFQPGELIAEPGRHSQYIYLITEGQVDVLEQVGGNEIIRGTLGPGSHFGHATRDADRSERVRARTTVRAVTVHADQAQLLQQMLAPLTIHEEAD
jgi:CRP-like cAMP-binding protein